MKNTESLALVRKAHAVICSCKTPAQLRVANTYAYRVLSVIGHMMGERYFNTCHRAFNGLLNAKARQMRLRKMIF